MELQKAWNYNQLAILRIDLTLNFSNFLPSEFYCYQARMSHKWLDTLHKFHLICNLIRKSSKFFFRSLHFFIIRIKIYRIMSFCLFDSQGFFFSNFSTISMNMIFLGFWNMYLLFDIILGVDLHFYKVQSHN